MNLPLADILAKADRLRESGDAFCLVTVVRTANATSAKAGAKAVVTGDGVVHGFVGGGCVTGAVRKVALEVMTGAEPRLIRVKPKDEVVAGLDVDGVELHRSSCPSGGTVDLFFEPFGEPQRIVICGTSPVAVVLGRLARAMGYRAVAATTRDERDLIGQGNEWLEGYDFDAAAIEPRDAIVVVTQGRGDRRALKGALSSAAVYVGMVGSRAKIANLKAKLAGEIPADRLKMLHGPAGLAIGAIDPEEIALAILAEIVRVRRARTRAAASEELPSEVAKSGGINPSH